MKNKPTIKWLDKPESRNYPDALSYLSLIYDTAIAKRFVAQLKTAPVSSFKAKDIFRASSLSLLGISNLHVKKDRDKIKKGIELSPLLLLRDTPNGKVIIADGYHRLCAIYGFDEDAVIRCKII